MHEFSSHEEGSTLNCADVGLGSVAGFLLHWSVFTSCHKGVQAVVTLELTQGRSWLPLQQC